jgi:hypothetical protein
MELIVRLVYSRAFAFPNYLVSIDLDQTQRSACLPCTKARADEALKLVGALLTVTRSRLGGRPLIPRHP